MGMTMIIFDDYHDDENDNHWHCNNDAKVGDAAGGDQWVGMMRVMTMIIFEDYHDDNGDDNDNHWNGNNDTIVGEAAF